MLVAMVEAAWHWLAIGLPLRRLKIVVHPNDNPAAMAVVFGRVKERLGAVSVSHGAAARPPKFDAFISYSHEEREQADALISALAGARPALRLFVDRLELRPGAAWQQHIYDALDDCRKVVTLLSPAYLASKVCKEEFNIAVFRHRESSEDVLIPIFLRTANLPTYMKLLQGLDAREGQPEKLAEVADRLVHEIG